MQIYLPDLKLKQGEAVDYHFEEDLSVSFCDFPDGGSLKLDLSASYNSDQVLINGRLEVSATASCSRCLETFKQHFKTDFTESFAVIKGLPAEGDRRSESIDAANSLEFSGDYLYLDEYIRQMIILAQEYNPVCDPGCKGLCAGCGVDLNKSSCQCDKDPEDIDLRLLKLKEINKES